MPMSRRRRGLTCDVVSLPSARLAQIGELLDFVDAFCEQAGIGERDQFDLRLAIEEVCANVMMHGYAERAPGPLELSFCADDETVSVTISDRAAPFDPEHAPPPDLNAPAEQRPIGGLGWHLVRQVMDDVRYRYDPTYGNTVILTKKIALTDEAPESRLPDG
jgi:anti-sigma regulatory factor (Ser/Thr protein kinase)